MPAAAQKEKTGCARSFPALSGSLYISAITAPIASIVRRLEKASKAQSLNDCPIQITLIDEEAAIKPAHTIAEVMRATCMSEVLIRGADDQPDECSERIGRHDVDEQIPQHLWDHVGEFLIARRRHIGETHPELPCYGAVHEESNNKGDHRCDDDRQIIDRNHINGTY